MDVIYDMDRYGFRKLVSLDTSITLKGFGLRNRGPNPIWLRTLVQRAVQRLVPLLQWPTLSEVQRAGE